MNVLANPTIYLSVYLSIYTVEYYSASKRDEIQCYLQQHGCI